MTKQSLTAGPAADVLKVKLNHKLAVSGEWQLFPFPFVH